MSFSAEYTTKRNDHANWKQPSRRRGTYFGTYAAPKESIRTSPRRQQSPESEHDGNPNTGNGSGRKRNPHVRTKRFLHRVSQKRISGKFSSDEITLFRRKNAELEEHLDNLQKQFDELEREHMVVQGEYEISQGKVEELNKSIQRGNEENKRVNGLLILEKARAQAAAEKAEAVEQKFQKELDEYKGVSEETIRALESSLDDLNERLQKSQRQLREMFELREENLRRKEECKRMKQSLVKAKAYTLHKALNATVAASKTQSLKMQRIIAHLQAEHAALNTALEEVIAERNVLREELDKGGEHSGNATQEQDAQALAQVESHIDSVTDKLSTVLSERDALARYARHLEERLGVDTGPKNIHISKHGSVQMSYSH